MTSFITSQVGRIPVLMFVFTYGLLVARAHTMNDVLASEHSHSSASSDYEPAIEPSDDATVMSSAPSSALDLSSAVESSDPEGDTSYVPSNDSTGESSVSSSSVMSSVDLSSIDDISSQDVDSHYVPPDDVDELSSASSDGSSSSLPSGVDLSAIDESSQADVDDPSYVPPDGIDELSSASSDGSSSSQSSVVDLSASDESSQTDVDDPSYVPPDVIDELSSASSDGSSSSLSSVVDLSAIDEPSQIDVDDPSYVPSSDQESSSSSVTGSYDATSAPVENKLLSGAGKRRREPASHDPSRKPEKTTDPDNDSRRKPGRAPAVFNGPRQDGGTAHREGHGKRIVPSGDTDDAGSSDRKPEKGRGRPAPANGKGTPSKRLDRQWGGPPSPQRLKELKEADTKYLDLYLCGQFLLGSADGSVDDFAVASFNYAGRTQPFSPCSELGTTEETVNYIYRTTGRDDATAFQKVVDDLPATWQRYVAENGRLPRVVHVFAANMPKSVAEVSSLLRLRSLHSYRSARFVLGYLNQPIPDEPTSDSAREFLDLLGELDRAGIETVRVCGRCAKVASSNGRRRRDMQYGMSVVSEASAPAACRPLQEYSIPGAQFTGNTCDSFQKSVVRCTLRAIQRRCQGVDTGTVSSTDEALLDAVNGLARVCGLDSDCWRREGESIRERIVPKSKTNRCNMPEVAVSKMLGRCAEGAAGLPFDV